MDAAGTRSSVDDIVARLERLPTSWWQVKARIIVGVATFFDAFDALAIASVLPVIVPLWKLTPPQIGLMISAGFLGQLLGALLFGWIAERYGRMTAMIWSIALFAVMSLACAFAWDYSSLLVLRTIQGIGLGGEVPVAAVFISELAKAKRPRALRSPVRARLPHRIGGGEPGRPVGRAPSRLAIHVRHRRAAGAARARAAQPAAGIPALAGGARPQVGGRGGDVADRGGNAEGDRTAAAAG
jgi:hypothetical protein